MLVALWVIPQLAYLNRQAANSLSRARPLRASPTGQRERLSRARALLLVRRERRKSRDGPSGSLDELVQARVRALLRVRAFLRVFFANSQNNTRPPQYTARGQTEAPAVRLSREASSPNSGPSFRILMAYQDILANFTKPVLKA